MLYEHVCCKISSFYTGFLLFLLGLHDAGIKDAFIICLNASESIDATRKGSLGRFINHSW